MHVGILALVLFAANDAAAPEVWRLDNGVEVVVIEDHSLPLLSVQVWFGVGSAHDPAELPGRTHVARTLLNDRANAALRLRGAGVWFAGHTERDTCCFETLTPPAFLDFVLRIEAERMRPRPVTASELHAAVHAAARAYAPDDERALDRNNRALLAAAFRDHPYGHPPTFVAASLTDWTVADAETFIRRWFVPGNARLVVVGDVRTPRVKDLIERHFGELDWAEPPSRPQLPPIHPGRVELPPVEAARSGVTFAWVTPPLGSFETTVIDVLMHHLCDAEDALLRTALQGIGCKPSHWKHRAWRDAGLLTLNVVQRAAHQLQKERITELVFETLRTASERICTPVELNTARGTASGALRAKHARFRARALNYGRYEALTGEAGLAAYAAPRIAATYVDDLRQAAADLLTTRVVIQPHLPVRDQQAVPASTAPAPIAPLLPEVPELLTGRAATNLLLEHTSDAPAVPATEPTRAAHSHDLAEHVTLKVIPIQGLSPAAVRTRVTGPSPDPIALRIRPYASAHWTAAQYRAYERYHGLTLTSKWHPTGFDLDAIGPSHLVPQMLELQAAAIRHPAPDTLASEFWPRDAQIEVVVAGDVSAADVLESARSAWPDWDPATIAAAARQHPPRPSANSETRPTSSPASSEPSFCWTTDDAPARISASDTLTEPGNGWTATDRLILRAALRTVGHPRGDKMLDNARSWRWQAEMQKPFYTVFTAALPVGATGESESIVQDLLTELERLSAGALPSSHATLGLRHARLDRWLELQSAADIIAATDTWLRPHGDALEDIGPEHVNNWLRQHYRPVRRDYRGRGPSRDRAAFESLAPSKPSASQPSR